MFKKRLISIIVALSMVAARADVAFAAENVFEDITVYEDNSEYEDELSSESSSFNEFTENEDEVVIEEGAGSGELTDAADEASEADKTGDEKKAGDKSSYDSASDMQQPTEFYTGALIEENSLPITRLETEEDASFNAGEELPASYKTALLPALKNQSPHGTCWAFCLIGLTEINLMKKGEIESPDLSELHLAYFTKNSAVDPLGGTEGDFIVTDNGSVLSQGGVLEQGLATLEKWQGAADEETVKYGRDDEMIATIGLPEGIAYDDAAHVQSYYIEQVDLSKFRSTKDISMLAPVKKLIMDQGAVGIIFGALNGYVATTSASTYSEKYNSFYNPEYLTRNHAVVVVGWDDNFPKEHFSTTAPGDGAFLVKNSWTTEDSASHDSFSGYFWMSYYESSLYDRFYAVDAEAADNYDNNYQYDSYGLSTSSAKAGANVFTAHAQDGVNGEILEAVSFYALVANADYTINIYTDIEGSFTDGNKTLRETITGKTSYGGYNTVVLDTPILLAPGEKFAVAVEMNTYGIMTEYCGLNSSSMTTTSKPGQSYKKLYNDNWQSMDDNGNIWIKAYTNNVELTETVAPSEIVISNVENGAINLNVNEMFKVDAKVLPVNAADKTIVWKSSNEAVATVKDGRIVPLTEGTAVITATTADGKISEKIKLTVELKLISVSSDMYKTWDFITGETYFSLKYVLFPKSYVPKKIAWKSTCPEAVTVDQNGRVYYGRMGRAEITLDVDGVSDTFTMTSSPTEQHFKYEFTDDRKVVLRWESAVNADRYMLFRNNALVTTIENDGRDYYEYTDDYFVNAENQKVTYGFAPVYGDDYSIKNFSFTIGNSYSITYHLNGGTQNPANPEKYISGNYYELFAPTAPEDYVFVSWCTDEKLENSISGIYMLMTGDIDLYAKYRMTDPKIYFDKDNYEIHAGEKLTLTARHAPKNLSLSKWNWYCNNYDTTGYEFKTSGNTATFKAKYAGTYYIQVSNGNLYAGVNVTVLPAENGKDDIDEGKDDGSEDGRDDGGDTDDGKDDIDIEDDDTDGWGDVASLGFTELFGGDNTKVPAGLWYVIGDKLYTAGGATEYEAVYSGDKLSFNSRIFVFHGTRRLYENRDYTVSYGNNTAAAGISSQKAPSFTIKGKGSYSSQVSFKFSIAKADIDNAAIASGKVVSVVAGKSAKLGSVKPVITYNGKTLKAGKDYVLSYYDGEAIVNNPAKEALTEAGKTYIIRISAASGSSFDGVKEETVTVNVVDSKDKAESSAAAIPIKSARISGLKTTVEYTGKAITLEDLTSSADGLLYVVDTKARTATNLVRSVDGAYGDYYVSMENNGAVGKFDLYIIGINGFYGQIKKTITVKPCSLKPSADRIVVVEAGDARYSKSGAASKVMVSVVSGYETTVLKEGIDYTLSYKNNKKVGQATVVVKGIGNYTGSTSENFSVTRAGVSRISVSAKDVVFNASGKPGYFKVVPKLVDDGAALTVGKNKDVEPIDKSAYAYYYAESTVLMDGSTRAAGDVVQDLDRVLPGTVIKVEVGVRFSENSPYSRGGAATLEGYYKVVDSQYDISKSKVTVRNAEKLSFNNGKSVEITADDLEVTLKSGNAVRVLNADDFEIVSVKNNKFLGTASVVLRGVGNYGGTKSFTFKIKAKSLG